MLLATDKQRTVVNVCAAELKAFKTISYTPYGDSPRRDFDEGLLAYTGERYDGVLRGYHLGNGYRFYGPTFRRFASPDNMSPFGRGGTNYYIYCVNDPGNKVDPSGHMWRYRSQGAGRFGPNLQGARQGHLSTGPEFGNIEGLGHVARGSSTGAYGSRRGITAQTDSPEPPSYANVPKQAEFGESSTAMGDASKVLSQAKYNSPEGVDLLCREYPQFARDLYDYSNRRARDYLSANINGEPTSTVGMLIKHVEKADYLLASHNDPQGVRISASVIESSATITEVVRVVRRRRR